MIGLLVNDLLTNSFQEKGSDGNRKGQRKKQDKNVFSEMQPQPDFSRKCGY